MNTITRMLLLLLMIGWAPVGLPAAEAPAGASPGAYRIGPGDVLDIAAWKNEDLTRVAVVLPDGKIAFPLVGEVTAAGKTVAQLKQEVESRLVKYVPEPTLSVTVRQVNSLHIYVIGKVNQPGRFVLNATVNALQALAMAGGLNPFADKNGIKIFRKQGETTRLLEFRYDDVTAGKRLEQNIDLQRGDVIVVP